MRQFFLILGLLSFFCSAASAQATTQSAFVGTCQFNGFTASGPNVVGTLANFLDQTNLYFASDIQVGDVAWDNLGTRWEIVAVTSSNLVQAVVEMRNVNGTGGLPFGVGYVSRETPNIGLSMFPPDNSIGISPQLKSRVEGHNALLIDSMIQAVKNLIPGANPGQKILYVSKSIGDNATAQVGSYLFPFKDPWAARDTAISKAIVAPAIIIFDGEFKWYQGSPGICSDCDFSGTTQPEISLIRNNFTYLSLPGVKFISGGGALNPLENCIFSDTSGYKCSFLGSADFFIPTQTRISLLQHPNADFTFQCNKIENPTGSGSIAALFQIKKTGIALSGGGGFKNFQFDVNTIRVGKTTSVIFALWGQSPFLDTLKAVNYNINIKFLDAEYINGLIRVDPMYAKIDAFTINVGTAQLQAVPNVGNGFEIFVLGRTGWVNSRINLTIQNLIMPTTAPSYQYIYGWSSGKVWTNTVQRLYIGSAVGAWRLFSGFATVAGGTGNKIYWDINGVNEDITDPVYNFGGGGNAGYDMYISGNLLAKTPLFSYEKSDGRVTFLNFNAITTGQLFTSTVSRTDTMFFLNSYLQGASAASITGNFPMTSASSTFLPLLPTKNYTVTYSLGELWRSASFTATASQTTYTVSTARLPSIGANIRVVVDGLEKIEGAGEYYTYVPSTGVITFNAPLSAGQKVKISWFD